MRFLYVLFVFLVVFAVVSLFDVVEIWGFVKFLSDDQSDFAILVLALITIGIIAFLLRIIINLRNKLNKWAFAFERNSIMASISIRLSKLEKREILDSIIDTIPEIGIPLKEYIMDNGGNTRQFTDQKIPWDLYFDMLIDDTQIADDDGDGKNDYLKNKTDMHGAIIVKVEKDGSAADGGGVIDIKSSKLFVQSLLKYAKTTKKFVGLALLCGTEITDEAAEFISGYSNKAVGYLICYRKAA